ncbi:PREDICTED: interleukin-34 isoform X3 [Chinchilla lanigera]|uniref:interleukin-34 isoform X3 n=1 Tax=Chinchilla lanigera TaxID=34839 RepID=UPI00038EF410|nr:PREDICTED: interleukin-34 isoform X3 [Chinchilla lanigera]
MPRGLTCLLYLGILLGVPLGNEGLTQNKECAVTGFLRDKLRYRNRLQYMNPGPAPRPDLRLPEWTAATSCESQALIPGRDTDRQIEMFGSSPRVGSIETLLPHQLPDQRALRGGAQNRQHHQAEEPGERAGAALSVGLGESQRHRVGAGGAARGPPVLAVPGGGPDAAAERAAEPRGCGDQPPSRSCIVCPQYPRPEPEAGEAQSPAGQLLPGHGAAVLFLL